MTFNFFLELSYDKLIRKTLKTKDIEASQDHSRSSSQRTIQSKENFHQVKVVFIKFLFNKIASHPIIKLRKNRFSCMAKFLSLITDFLETNP